MLLKFQFLHLPLDFFPENLGEASDEQGKRFNQGIKSTEHRSRFLERLYDGCDDPDTSHHTKRKSAHFKLLLSGDLMT